MGVSTQGVGSNPWGPKAFIFDPGPVHSEEELIAAAVHNVYADKRLAQVVSSRKAEITQILQDCLDRVNDQLDKGGDICRKAHFPLLNPFNFEDLQELAQHDFTIELHVDHVDAALRTFIRELLDVVWCNAPLENTSKTRALERHNEAMQGRMETLEHHLRDRAKQLSHCRFAYFLEITHLRNQVYIKSKEPEGKFVPVEAYFFDPTEYLEEELRQQLNDKISLSVKVYQDKLTELTRRCEDLEMKLESAGGAFTFDPKKGKAKHAVEALSAKFGKKAAFEAVKAEFQKPMVGFATEWARAQGMLLASDAELLYRTVEAKAEESKAHEREAKRLRDALARVQEELKAEQETRELSEEQLKEANAGLKEAEEAAAHAAANSSRSPPTEDVRPRQQPVAAPVSLGDVEQMDNLRKQIALLKIQMEKEREKTSVAEIAVAEAEARVAEAGQRVATAEEAAECATAAAAVAELARAEVVAAAAAASPSPAMEPTGLETSDTVVHTAAPEEDELLADYQRAWQELQDFKSLLIPPDGAKGGDVVGRGAGGEGEGEEEGEGDQDEEKKEERQKRNGCEVGDTDAPSPDSAGSLSARSRSIRFAAIGRSDSASVSSHSRIEQALQRRSTSLTSVSSRSEASNKMNLHDTVRDICAIMQDQLAESNENQACMVELRREAIEAEAARARAEEEAASMRKTAEALAANAAAQAAAAATAARLREECDDKDVSVHQVSPLTACDLGNACEAEVQTPITGTWEGGFYMLDCPPTEAQTSIEEELRDLSGCALGNWEVTLDQIRARHQPPLGCGDGSCPRATFLRLFQGARQRIARNNELIAMAEALTRAELHEALKGINFLMESSLPDFDSALRDAIFGRGLTKAIVKAARPGQELARVSKKWCKRMARVLSILRQRSEPITLGVHLGRRIFMVGGGAGGERRMESGGAGGGLGARERKDFSPARQPQYQGINDGADEDFELRAAEPMQAVELSPSVRSRYLEEDGNNPRLALAGKEIPLYDLAGSWVQSTGHACAHGPYLVVGGRLVPRSGLAISTLGSDPSPESASSSRAPSPQDCRGHGEKRPVWAGGRPGLEACAIGVPSPSTNNPSACPSVGDGTCASAAAAKPQRSRSPPKPPCTPSSIRTSSPQGLCRSRSPLAQLVASPHRTDCSTSPQEPEPCVRGDPGQLAVSQTLPSLLSDRMDSTKRPAAKPLAGRGRHAGALPAAALARTATISPATTAPPLQQTTRPQTPQASTLRPHTQSPLNVCSLNVAASSLSAMTATAMMEPAAEDELARSCSRPTSPGRHPGQKSNLGDAGNCGKTTTFGRLDEMICVSRMRTAGCEPEADEPQEEPAPAPHAGRSCALHRSQSGPSVGPAVYGTVAAVAAGATIVKGGGRMVNRERDIKRARQKLCQAGSDGPQPTRVCEQWKHSQRPRTAGGRHTSALIRPDPQSTNQQRLACSASTGRVRAGTDLTLSGRRPSSQQSSVRASRMLAQPGTAPHASTFGRTAKVGDVGVSASTTSRPPIHVASLPFVSSAAAATHDRLSGDDVGSSAASP